MASVKGKTEFVTDFGSDILSPGLQSQCFEKIDMQNSKIKKKGRIILPVVLTAETCNNRGKETSKVQLRKVHD